MSPPEPPEHVRAAFGVPDDPPIDMDRGSAWRCGEVVLSPVTSTAEAVWVANALDGLHVDGVRLPRTLRSTDGRWVVAGWGATRYVSGCIEPRHDEVVAVAERLHAATADLDRPDFLTRADAGSDLYGAADAAAWGDAEPDLDPDRRPQPRLLLPAGRGVRLTSTDPGRNRQRVDAAISPACEP